MLLNAQSEGVGAALSGLDILFKLGFKKLTGNRNLACKTSLIRKIKTYLIILTYSLSYDVHIDNRSIQF